MSNENTSLSTQFPDSFYGTFQSQRLSDTYKQFCQLVGIKPVNEPPKSKWKSPPDSLYYRASRHLYRQRNAYIFTASLTNSLLLSQVILGAVLTALGASNSSHILVTIFGALNTVIAGLIAFIKSRGEPVRSRMFRDDLERVVDEIENSAIMWYGISQNAHGYDAIDTSDQVTVRSEVARLTRLYEHAVKRASMNDPDNYSGAATDPYNAALRSRPPGGQQGVIAPVTALPPAEGPAATKPAAAAPAAPIDPDDSPATKPEPPKPKVEEPPKDAATKADNKAPEVSPDATKAESSKDAAAAKPDAAKPAADGPKDSKVSLPLPESSGAAGPSNAVPAAPTSALPNDDDPEPAAEVTLPEKHSEDTSKTDETKV